MRPPPAVELAPALALLGSAADLGLSASDLEPAVTLKAFGTPPGRPAGRILEGDAATTAKELVRLLREEAKVI